MLVRSYTLPPTPDYPLYIVAKRYWIPSFEANIGNPAAKTLIVLHSTSFHKETWEPTLEDLFKFASQSKTEVLIRDAWAIDCPNHGESAVLNSRVLEDPRFQAKFSCERYAHAVHRFLSSGPEGGIGVDFRRRDLVGVGHSLGGNAMLMLQHIEPVIKFSKLIIVEPMTSAEGRHHLDKLHKRLVSGAAVRESKWTSREAAYKSLMTRKRKWDPRVVQAFMNHGIYWNPQANAFIRSCSREQETAMYEDAEGTTKPIEHLNKICHRIPTHLILGQVPDLIPVHVHKALVNPNSGRRYASVVSIPNIGHLIPQEVPGTLASLIYDALSSSAGPLPSKL